jgi:hypothetical protein
LGNRYCVGLVIRDKDWGRFLFDSWLGRSKFSFGRLDSEISFFRDLMTLSEVLDGAKNLLEDNLRLLLSKFVILPADIVFLLRHVVIIRTRVLLVFNLIKHFFKVALRSFPLRFYLLHQRVDFARLIRVLVLSAGHPFSFPFLCLSFEFIRLFFQSFDFA